ncbi:hypothetical protein Bbelb_025340 [Branchiostoma belcheri]|nr:hypothetical protein Bbelb_025340 [Branchiostoma belcheri]
MSKAFDRVDHAIPLQHVIDIQASPCMVTWIHSYLSGRRQRVEVNGVASSWKEPTPGASQGGVLSPYLFLFNIYTSICRDRVLKKGYWLKPSLNSGGFLPHNNWLFCTTSCFPVQTNTVTRHAMRRGCSTYLHGASSMELAPWRASFTASGGTTSAFGRDTLGGGHQQADR